MIILVHRYVSTKLQVSTAFLLREKRRYGTAGHTDKRPGGGAVLWAHVIRRANHCFANHVRSFALLPPRVPHSLKDTAVSLPYFIQQNYINVLLFHIAYSNTINLSSISFLFMFCVHLSVYVFLFLFLHDYIHL